VRLYLDTSALVSIYFPEPHTIQTPTFLEKATKLLTSYATYAEASAALSQIRHAKRIRKNAYDIAIERLESEWVRFERFEVNERTTRLAGLLAREYLLKGYDSIHLSTALVMCADKIFTYDHKLSQVATSVGLEVVS
jgi:predicted nucleic acid-binding protein